MQGGRGRGRLEREGRKGGRKEGETWEVYGRSRVQDHKLSSRTKLEYSMN